MGEAKRCAMSVTVRDVGVFERGGVARHTVQQGHAREAPAFSAVSRAAVISASDAMPVEMEVSGFRLDAAYAISGRSTASKEAIL